MAATAGVRNSGVLRPALASPQWQVFLILHGYYTVALLFVQLLIFIWKGVILPYPDDVLVIEILLLLVIMSMEAGRLFWGIKGNLTERRLACFISVAMSMTSICGSLYFLLWQTYVLTLEAILFIIHMTLVVLETIFGIVTFVGIQKSMSPP